jgi:hypothetical protein
MGTDVHIFREQFSEEASPPNGRWISKDKWTEHWYVRAEKPQNKVNIGVAYEDTFTERNYALFGLLSKGVRSDWGKLSHVARGVPIDMSSPVSQVYYGERDDIHSASYMTLKELSELRTKLMLIGLPEGQNHTVAINGLDSLIDFIREILPMAHPSTNTLIDYSEYRIIYWFDS